MKQLRVKDFKYIGNINLHTDYVIVDNSMTLLHYYDRT